MRRLRLLLAALSVVGLVHGYQPGSGNWMTQGFYFNWQNNSQTPIPITAHCDTLRIESTRGGGEGPDPKPPYVAHIYASNHTYPIIVPLGDGPLFSLPISFAPRIQYVLCMTDSTGVSGGCQDLYTVFPVSGNRTCPEFPIPDETLDVKIVSLVTGGELPPYAWPDGCSDIEMEPQNGTPPYTLSVVPAYRPPLNITFDKVVRWTMTVDHSSSFFLSITDSNGIGWSHGVMHAGQGSTGSTYCLSGSTARSGGLNVQETVGASIGSFVLGILLAVIAFWFLVRRQQRRSRHLSEKLAPSSPFPQASPATREVVTPSRLTGNVDLTGSNPNLIATVAPLSSPPSTWNKRRPQYAHLTSNDSASISASASPQQQIQALDTIAAPPGSQATLSRMGSHGASISTHSPPTQQMQMPPSSPPWRDANMPTTPPPDNDNMHDVYVVHHDAGAAPVTVYTRAGARVVEMPPGYRQLSTDNTPGSNNAGPSRASHLTLATVDGESDATPRSESPITSPSSTERKASFRTITSAASPGQVDSAPSPPPGLHISPSQPHISTTVPPVIGPNSAPPDFDAIIHERIAPNQDDIILPASTTSNQISTS